MRSWSPATPDPCRSQNTPHRLQTRSVAQIIAAARDPAAQPIPTGLTGLDDALSASTSTSSSASVSSQLRSPGRGLPRGKVTYVFGPPGSGKSTFCLNVAANALRAGRSVLWLDCGTPLFRPRLVDILGSDPGRPDTNADPESDAEILTRFRHLRTPSLPHLLSILVHTPASYFSPFSLVVVDSLSTGVDLVFPNPNGPDQSAPSRQSRSSPSSPAIPSLSARRATVLSKIGTSLSRIAATHGFAAIVTSSMNSRVRSPEPAVLTPSLAGPEWDIHVAVRLLFFRDWIASDHPSSSSSQSRFVALLRPLSNQTKPATPATPLRTPSRPGRTDSGLPLLPPDGSLVEPDFDPNIGPVSPSAASAVVACFAFDITRAGLVERSCQAQAGDRAASPPKHSLPPEPSRSDRDLTRSLSSYLPSDPFASSPPSPLTRARPHSGADTDIYADTDNTSHIPPPPVPSSPPAPSPKAHPARPGPVSPVSSQMDPRLFTRAALPSPHAGLDLPSSAALSSLPSTQLSELSTLSSVPPSTLTSMLPADADADAGLTPIPDHPAEPNGLDQSGFPDTLSRPTNRQPFPPSSPSLPSFLSPPHGDPDRNPPLSPTPYSAASKRTFSQIADSDNSDGPVPPGTFDLL